MKKIKKIEKLKRSQKYINDAVCQADIIDKVSKLIEGYNRLLDFHPFLSKIGKDKKLKKIERATKKLFNNSLQWIEKKENYELNRVRFFSLLVDYIQQREKRIELEAIRHFAMNKNFTKNTTKSMPEYELLKDLPGIKKGDIFEWVKEESAYMNREIIGKNYFDDRYRFDRVDVKNLSDWFREIKE